MRSQVTAPFGHTALRVRPLAGPRTGFIRCPFQLWIPAFAVMTLMVAALPTLPARAEALKLGGTLTYVSRHIDAERIAIRVGSTLPASLPSASSPELAKCIA